VRFPPSKLEKRKRFFSAGYSGNKKTGILLGKIIN
jgi:hypothetical protein